MKPRVNLYKLDNIEYQGQYDDPPDPPCPGWLIVLVWGAGVAWGVGVWYYLLVTLGGML